MVGTRAPHSWLCLPLLCVFIAGAEQALLAYPAPKPTQADPRWGVKADPPARPVSWPDTLKVSIAQPARQEEILFPSGHSEFCMVGLDAYESDKGELWNLATGTRAGVITGNPAKATKRALSSDGKYLAVATLDRAKANEIEVWSAQSGKRLCTFTADDKSLPLPLLDFAGPGEVLTYTFGQINGKFVYHLRVWDAETGKSLRQFDLDKNISGDKRYDVSPGGHWLATIVNRQVLLYDLQSGQVKGTITPPEKTDDGDFVSLDAARFSPDGSELACICEGQKSAVLTVNDVSTGAVKLKHDLAASTKKSLQNAASYKGPQIEFVAAPASFLWSGGGLIDRETGLLVWTYRQGTLEFSHWRRILTPAGLIVSTGGNGSRKIQSVPFPADKLQKSLDAYRGDAPAIVKPGEKVKVVVNVGKLRFGKPEETKSELNDALAERLADDGLAVDDGGGTVMTVDYSETAGKTLQETKGGNPIRPGTPTGKSVQSTAADVKLSWVSTDGKTKIFETTFNLDPSFVSLRPNEQLTEEAVHKHVFAMLKIRLNGLPMPFFVAKDSSISPLPVATASDMAAPGSKEDLLKKKIEAKKNVGKKPTK